MTHARIQYLFYVPLPATNNDQPNQALEVTSQRPPSRSHGGLSLGKGKAAQSKDLSLRKHLPRSSQNRTKNSPDELVLPDSPLKDKATDRKPLAGRSPTEVDRALHDRNLPEDQLLVICFHASPALKTQTKNMTKNSSLGSSSYPLTSLERSLPPGKMSPRSPSPLNPLSPRKEMNYLSKGHHDPDYDSSTNEPKEKGYIEKNKHYNIHRSIHSPP